LTNKISSKICSTNKISSQICPITEKARFGDSTVERSLPKLESATSGSHMPAHFFRHHFAINYSQRNNRTQTENKELLEENEKLKKR